MAKNSNTENGIVPIQESHNESVQNGHSFEEKTSVSNSVQNLIPLPKMTRRISEIKLGNHLQTSQRILTKRCKHVLVIITGGTIVMKSEPRTGKLIPERGFVYDEIKKTPTLHDDAYFKKYQRNSELTESELHTTFVLPKYVKSENRIIYSVFEYPVLLDSCNMHIDDYCKIARSIYDVYEKYDGFVVIHGTDTMAYTASYLSFMFENLGKTVILTGSQIPLCASRTDGVDNLQGAILIAGNYTIPEVTIFFHHRLFRGNRVIKVDTSNFNAYDSANLEPIMTMGVHIHTNWDIVWRSPYLKKFSIFTNLNPNVGLLRLFPGITVETIRAFTQPPIVGVALQSYGAGNGPSNRQDIINVLKETTDRGVFIVNCTQCHKGGVSVAYETGKALYDAGVVPGYDITPEAALAKLSYIAGKTNLTQSQKKQLLLSNIRGELSKKEESAVVENNEFISAVAEAMSFTSKSELDILKMALFPPLLCAAAKQNDTVALEKLRSQGADLSLQDYDGRSALHIAVSQGNIECVKFLLTHGASVHVSDRFGNTPLIDAISFKQMECIKLLIQVGAHITACESVIGLALCTLAYENDLEGLKAWDLAGAKLNGVDYENRTPLHVAVLQENIEIVKYLIENESTLIKCCDISGQTPLDIAKAKKSRVMTELLIKAEHEELEVPVL